MFFDCRRMGPERRFDLVVSDVDRRVEVVVDPFENIWAFAAP